MPAQFPRNEEGLFVFKYGGQDAAGDVMVTIGFHDDDAGGFDQSRNDDVSDAWEDVVAVTLCSQMNYLGLDTLIADGSDIFEFHTVVSVAGGLTGNTMLPLNNAVIVKKVTGLAGRRNRGRIYLPGIPEDAVDDQGDVLGSFITTINTAMNNFRDTVEGLNSGSMYLALLHREILIPAKPAYALADAENTRITTFVTDAKQGSQRGRLRD